MKMLIVDGQWVCRLGLERAVFLLDPDTQLIEAETFQRAVEISTESNHVGLIIWDPVSSDTCAAERISELFARSPVPVLVFSYVDEPNEIMHLIDLGASGYISKLATEEELLKAVRFLLSGQMYFPPGLRKGAPHRRRKRDPSTLISVGMRESIICLTDRQRELLKCLAQGMTIKKIAEQLGLSENSARLQILEILQTLKLKTRAQAALIAADCLRSGNIH